MKRAVLCLMLLVLTGAIAMETVEAKTGTSVGIEYNSEYYWRGMSFYGEVNATRGVLFPWVGQALGDFYFTISGEIPTAYLENEPNAVEEAWLGIDFIAAYNKTILDDALLVGGRVAYFMYPQSKDKSSDGYRNDFFDLSAWVQLKKVFLKPKLKYSQYLRVSDRGGSQDNLKDIYVELSVSHAFQLYKNVSLTLGGWTSYFYYPSANENGYCDIAAYSKLAVSVGDGLSLYGKFNAAIVTAPWHDISGGQDRLHLWATAGVSYGF